MVLLFTASATNSFRITHIETVHQCDGQTDERTELSQHPQCVYTALRGNKSWRTNYENIISGDAAGDTDCNRVM